MFCYTMFARFVLVCMARIFRSMVQSIVQSTVQFTVQSKVHGPGLVQNLDSGLDRGLDFGLIFGLKCACASYLRSTTVSLVVFFSLALF